MRPDCAVPAQSASSECDHEKASGTFKLVGICTMTGLHPSKNVSHESFTKTQALSPSEGGREDMRREVIHPGPVASMAVTEEADAF